MVLYSFILKLKQEWKLKIIGNFMNKELEKLDAIYGSKSLFQLSLYAGTCVRLIDRFGRDNEIQGTPQCVKFLEWYSYRHGSNGQFTTLTPRFIK